MSVKFGTLVIHSGNDPEMWNSKSILTPIVTSTTYKIDEPVEPGLYTQFGNPTRSALQQTIASLEGGKYGFVVNSGSTTVSVLVNALMKNGDNIILPQDGYYGTWTQLRDILTKLNIITTLINVFNDDEILSSIQDNTKIIWIDSPTNPLLRVIDIKKISKIAHDKECIVIVDNTFMTPCFQRPLLLGADVVINSATKYINGHGDVLMGTIATNNEDIAHSIQQEVSDTGTIPSPFDCYLVSRGIRTLHVRMKQHESNAFAVARFLQDSPHVEQVIYPGLKSHPEHKLINNQCTGYGGMVSFKINGGLENAKIFLSELKIFMAAMSLGGIESLAEICTIMTRKSMPLEEKDRIGITDNLIRLSVGLEDEEDLIEDLRQALQTSQQII